MQLHKAPANIEAEQCLISSMLIDQKCIPAVRREVNSSDFMRPGHSEIFNCICTLYEVGEPVELLTVQEELRTRKKLDEVGGMEYLITILNQEYSAKNFETYAKIVRDKSERRQIILAAHSAIRVAQDEELEQDAVYQGSLKPFLDIQKARKGKTTTMADAAYEALSTLSTNYYNGGVPMTTRFGVGSLDCKTLGIGKGMTIIGGRPSEGKTALMLQSVVSSREFGPFGFFSLEMDGEAIAYRQFASGTGINLMDIRKADLSESKLEQIGNYAANELFLMHNVYMSDATHITDILSEIQMWRLEYDIKAVYIDYLQLVDGPGNGETEKCVYVANKLKLLSKQIPIIAGAQLNREVEKSTPTKTNKQKKRRLPRLSDLKQTGKIEEHADMVILIDNEDGADESNLIIAKAKNGIRGIVPVHWDGGKQKFYPVSGDYDEAEERHYWEGN
jgi:replicative DNA helicase